ncbi:Inner membrane ABC transporter permease protein ycjO [Actinomyces viscosus]|uniref:Inner membrane ABC transporter permease protein ycjO n=2 Tax=Actinomyces viscosus TaxID=1656 RepID=A0A3S4VCE2_ACTVI|nr:Inner membrane ABC transporter permease protein ycjO [Actinomyces viscosus]
MSRRGGGEVTPSPPPSPKGELMTRIKRMNWTGVCFVAPSMIVVLALLIYPVFSSIWYSFTDKNLLRTSYHVVGISNYTDLLGSSSFWNAFGVSIKWTAASIIGQLAVGMVLALALDRVPRGSGLFRTLLIVPWAFPAIITAFAWKWILNDVYGFLPNLLTSLGLTDKNTALLGNPTTTFWIALLINIWFGAPMFMVNILSALKTIPQEQYEAAMVDGASGWQRFRFITLTHIREVIGLLVILRTIWVFNNFDMLFLLTGGGPGERTTTLPIFAYQEGWNLRQLGVASTVTILLLIFLLVLAFGAFRMLNRWEKERG